MVNCTDTPVLRSLLVALRLLMPTCVTVMFSASSEGSPLSAMSVLTNTASASVVHVESDAKTATPLSDVAAGNAG